MSAAPISWMGHLSFTAPTYKGDALDRLRKYGRSLWERTRRLILELSRDGMLFEFAERAYEGELKRLDRLIQTQIGRERARAKTISAELDLRRTELVGDLDPRFPANQHAGRSFGDDYVPSSGHLTKRGVEICYRLYDMGKSPIAVAYLMGISLRAAENRLSRRESHNTVVLGGVMYGSAGFLPDGARYQVCGNR